MITACSTNVTGNAMIYDNGMQFSSYDRDNDAKSGKNLASNSA